MREITVSASRLPIRKGSRVPGYPDLTVGRYLGGSPYTFDRIYDLEKKDGSSSGLVMKASAAQLLGCRNSGALPNMCVTVQSPEAATGIKQQV